MIKIQQHLDLHLVESLPFVLYVKPNSNTIIGYFQQDYEIYSTDDYLDKGFVFAPFTGIDNVFFPVENCEIIVDSIADLKVGFSNFYDEFPSKLVQEKHFELVQKGITAIQKGQIKKVVLSRKETIEVDDINFMLYFTRLIKAYPTAFRYLFFHPQVGFWMGATPEQLLKKKSEYIQTVALAGTQVQTNIDLVQWSDKEKEEQKIVTDFIIQNIEPFSTEIEISEPFTVQAGTLFHIKTEIKAKLIAPEHFANILMALHPTPALCGLPKQEAKEFIIANEGYDREYYAGFLGELQYNPETKQYAESDIFVNLRCMQLEYRKVHLYIGGGITAKSEPEAEFLETVNKSKTIKKILGT